MDFGEHNLPFAPGDILADKYRIDRVLGVGGMGVVVAATHLDLDSKVAIKVMRRELLSSESAVQRLLLEARSAAKIKSEHVARVLDVGTLPEGAPYIVMEFLDGCDLGQLLAEQGSLPVSQAVDFLLEACEALAEAHAAQIIHRDLKPENLFVARQADGSPSMKVLDFGISKQLGSAMGSRALTNPSTAVGSPQYMAPEQMQARAVDVRADIWALGAILYQLVSGQQAFDGETLPEVCAKVLSQDPPLLQTLRAELPKELEEIVSRCLRKDPDQRFSDVASLALALTPLGTAQARRSLERITRVLHGAASTFSLKPVTRKDQSASGSAATALATTPIATGGTFSSRPAERRFTVNLKWSVLVLVALVAIAGATLLLRTPKGDGTQQANSKAPTPATFDPVQKKLDEPESAAPAPDLPAASASTVISPPAASATAPVPSALPAIAPSAHPAKPARSKRTPANDSKSGAQEAWDPANFGGRH